MRRMKKPNAKTIDRVNKILEFGAETVGELEEALCYLDPKTRPIQLGNHSDKRVYVTVVESGAIALDIEPGTVEIGKESHG